jgi:hypothetical protein
MYPYLRYVALAVVLIAGTSAGAQQAMEIVTPAEYPVRLSSGTTLAVETFFQSDYFTQSRLTVPTAMLSAIISPTLSIVYALDRTVRPAKTPFTTLPTQPIVLAQRAEPVGRAIEQAQLKRVIRRAARTQKSRRSKARVVAQQPVQRCHSLFACLSVSSHAFQPAVPVTVER